MTEKIQASMATFMRIGEVIFKEQEWSEEFESQFKEQLKNHGGACTVFCVSSIFYK